MNEEDARTEIRTWETNFAAQVFNGIENIAILNGNQQLIFGLTTECWLELIDDEMEKRHAI